MTSVGFQGEVGAYSEEAVGLFFPEARPRPYPTFEAVFEALSFGEVSSAVVPIENTLAGSVHVNYDLLREHAARIVGEVHLRIRHNLLAMPGTRLEDIRLVLSHPQALGQCRVFLKQHLHRAEQVSIYDTAGAAKRVAGDRLIEAAAIASRKAAEVYGLVVLVPGIESDELNYTRFLALSRDDDTATMPAASAGDVPGYRTSIVYALRGAVPGALFRTLEAFAARSIDLLKIESRPLVGSPGDYLFYLDLDGAESDPSIGAALSNLRDMADFVRVLGSYPRGAWVDGRSG